MSVPEWSRSPTTPILAFRSWAAALRRRSRPSTSGLTADPGHMYTVLPGGMRANCCSKADKDNYYGSEISHAEGFGPPFIADGTILAATGNKVREFPLYRPFRLKNALENGRNCFL